MDWTDRTEETNRTANERDCVVDGEGNECRVTAHVTDYVTECSDKVPVQTHTLREFEQHLNDLKKENFSLKLRIYFLEERIQQKFEDSSDDVYKTNIELKVEVESLKQDLQEKQRLLDKALTTKESLTNHNEAELQRRCEERQQEIDHMQQVLETKIQILQEVAQLAPNEAERVASMTESYSQHPTFTMETVSKETSGDRSLESEDDANRDRERLEKLSAAVCCKEREIAELTVERRELRERVRQVEEQLQQVSNSLIQKERDAQFYQEELSHERLRVQQEMQSLIEEQQSQLSQYECAAGQCVSELQKAQVQVQSLQNKIHESEASNKKLQVKLCEMEMELQAIRQAAQNQERTIQNLTESLRTKDSENQELYHEIKGLNSTVCQLREIHDNELQQIQTPGGSMDCSSVVRLQSSLFSCQLQLEACQQDHRLTQRRMEDLIHSRDRLQADLCEALQHRETTHQHNQDLHKALDQLHSKLQVKTCELRNHEMKTRTEISGRDKTISLLQQNLLCKDTQLQEYAMLVECPSNSCLTQRDALLNTLRSRVRERDHALEDSIDEKFNRLKEKDEELQRLQLSLCEKDQDLERLNSILNNNNETLTSLDALVRRKEMDLQNMQESCQKLKWLRQKNEEKLTHTIQEQDLIINQLQTALHTHSKKTEELRSALLQKVLPGSADVLRDLQCHLSLKESLFQDVMSERSRQVQEHHRQITELLETLSSRDQEMQDYRERLGQVMSERSDQLQELRRQWLSQEQELTEVKRETARELQMLKSALKEKDNFTEVRLSSTSTDTAAQGECVGSTDDVEIQTVKEELQLSLRKQQQAELELVELRSALTTECSDHQSFLDQLVTEQQILNESLKTETTLYQNLRRIQSQENSSAEMLIMLNAELESLQALRRTLEEALARTRAIALAADRAALAQTGYEESSTDEDEDDEEQDISSEGFTDSIEENVKLTAQSLTITQNAGIVSRKVDKRLQEQNDQREQNENKAAEVTKKPKRSVCAHSRPAVQCGGMEKSETDHLKFHKLQGSSCTQQEEEYEEEEEDDDDEGEDVPGPQSKRGPPSVKLREGRWKRRCTRPHSLDLGALLSLKPSANQRAQEVKVEGGREGEAIGFWQHVEVGLREQAERLRSDLAATRQESRELQERLMVSEATVHALNDQLKDYRELLTESAVQRDSKKIQVDLQDLGYETSGRSENEAEREDASSPEFDESETRVSFSGTGSRRCSWHCNIGVPETDDPSSLKCLVQDLRKQLSCCHKIIRGLQLRVRSLSETSDYASSLERMARKVNWAAAAHSAEDEGWQSDGPVKPSKELQKLVSRVALLESQIKSSKLNGPEESKCATWPGKYNTLIQAQARELSHLRQKIREGRGICHILTQHLSDTTKAFEELLRANDIDYYMGQSFREQLSQNTSLAQSVTAKISGCDHLEQQEDNAAHELLALRLIKGPQQKDQIFESLHTKLQPRSDTPCSSHAPSETTDHSDHTSFVSDERVSTNGDVDLCSDMDVASEFAQEEVESRAKDRAFSGPLSHSFSFTTLSHHAPGHSGGTFVQTHANLTESSALWDMENIQGFGSCNFQSGKSQSGVDLIEEHLKEIRFLRQRLEDSIRTNERLKQQLEGHLVTAVRETESCEEVEQLRGAVLSGRVRLKQAELEADQWKEELRRLQTHNCDQSQQIQQLRQDRQNTQEQNNRLQHEVNLLQQQLSEGRQLLHSLQCELHLYQRVSGGIKSPTTGCKCKVQYSPMDLGDLLVEVRALRAQLEHSVQENGALRAQLQKQLDQFVELRQSPIIPASPLRDAFYRRQFLHDPSPSPPVRDVGPFPAASLYSPHSELEENANDSMEPHGYLEGDAPDGSFANRNGRHAIGHMDDYSALQQQMLEGSGLVQRIELSLQSCLNSALLEISAGKTLRYEAVKMLLSDTKSLHQILDEATSLLKMFWRAALPSNDVHGHLIKREQSMREEIHSLRLRIAEQEDVLQGTIQRLRSTSRTKESMENFIFNQLSRTRDVLKKARTNLEANISKVFVQVLLNEVL